MRVVSRSQRGDIIYLPNCPTQSRFFTRFKRGLLEIIGRCVKSDMALDHRILQVILNNLNRKFEDSETIPERLR